MKKKLKISSLPKTKNKTNLNRVHSYDFLRGIAILAVIIVHAHQVFPSGVSIINSVSEMGRFGVHLFFLVSALTMCHIWQQRKEQPNAIRKFYIRRIVRIAPLFWLAIPTYLYFNASGEIRWIQEDVEPLKILLTASFLHGFWPNYLNNVVPGAWSIAAEMIFYGFFPFLMLTIGNNKKLYLYLAFLIWAFNVFYFEIMLDNYFSEYYLSLLGNPWTPMVQEFLVLNFINVAPVYLIGCYLFFYVNERISFEEIFLLLTWIFVAAYAKYFFGINDVDYLLIYSSIVFFTIICVKRKINSFYIELLGKYSYGMYLFHFLAIFLINKLCSFDNYNHSVVYFMVVILVTILSFLLSLMLYNLIEKPIQKWVSRVT